MEDYETLLDEAEDELEDSRDLTESQLDHYGVGAGTVPEQKEIENLYNWFWKVVRLSKPFRLVKVGNLFNTEVGEVKMTVRDSMNMAHLGRTFGHPVFGDYFDTYAKIVSASSMARKGWFMDLSISQKRVRERKARAASSEKQRWRIFGRKKETATTQPQE